MDEYLLEINELRRRIAKLKFDHGSVVIIEELEAQLRILRAICEGERTVSEIVSLTQASQPNVSQNLALMYRHGVVARRRDGNQIYYRVKNELVVDLCRTVCTQVAMRQSEVGA